MGRCLFILYYEVRQNAWCRCAYIIQILVKNSQRKKLQK